MPAAAGGLDAQQRAALRRILQGRFPFLSALDLGPRSVAAGECDRCGEEPRMVQPCGPPPGDLVGPAGPDWALGRRCALAAGVEGWCAGHAEEAEAALAWLADLPDTADQVARLWWLATGEVRADGPLLRAARLALEGGPGAGDPGPG